MPNLKMILVGAAALSTLFVSTPANAASSFDNIAHRGRASTSVPESSRAGIKSVIDRGANGIELDVRMSKDNWPFVMHHEFSACTTGYATKTWNQLSKCKLSNGERLLDLDTALMAFQDRMFTIFLHLKDVNSTKDATRIRDTVLKWNLKYWVTYIGDNLTTLGYFKGQKLGYMVNHPADLNKTGMKVFVVYNMKVTKAQVAAVHKKGTKVYATDTASYNINSYKGVGLDGFLWRKYTLSLD